MTGGGLTGAAAFLTSQYEEAAKKLQPYFDKLQEQHAETDKMLPGTIILKKAKRKTLKTVHKLR